MPDERDPEREQSQEDAAKRREGTGVTPFERLPERAVDGDPDVEWHAGEDAGEVPAPPDDEEPGSKDDDSGPERDARDAADENVTPT